MLEEYADSELIGRMINRGYTREDCEMTVSAARHGNVKAIELLEKVCNI